MARNEHRYRQVRAPMLIICKMEGGRNGSPTPWSKELLHFDFLQMAFSAEDEDEYLLVLKDGFSTFVMLFPCRAATAAATVEGLLQWFSIFGAAEVWVSDQGIHFRNQIVTALQRKLRVHHHFVAAGCAWANGTIERANREALKVFRTLLAGMHLPPQRWRELLPVVRATVNATVSHTRLAGKSPYEVLFAEPPAHPLDTVIGVDFGWDEGDSSGDDQSDDLCPLYPESGNRPSRGQLRCALHMKARPRQCRLVG